jgi:hypothetical protein
MSTSQHGAILEELNIEFAAATLRERNTRINFDKKYSEFCFSSIQQSCEI